MIYGLISGLGLAAAAALTVWVDPFFQYHKPHTWFPYLVDHQVNMNPGLAKNMEYDSILLGSSMTVNFNTDWFAREMGLTTQKLSYNGAYPKDQSNIMEIAFDARGEKITDVFLGIDETTYSADINETKFPIPEYLYDGFLLNDVQYVWNKDVLLNYILRPLADPKDKSDWNMIYEPWWQDEHYQKALVLMYYEPAEEAEAYVEPETYNAAIEKNLTANICPFIEAHPDTTFHIFYPPYSILYWYDALRQQELDAALEKYRYITERLLAYDNVKVYFFQNQEEIICNLNNYADYTHYHGSICRYMVECFKNGQHRVTTENLAGELSVLEELTKTYDYEAIWDDWYN